MRGHGRSVGLVCDFRTITSVLTLSAPPLASIHMVAPSYGPNLPHARTALASPATDPANPITTIAKALRSNRCSLRFLSAPWLWRGQGL